MPPCGRRRLLGGISREAVAATDPDPIVAVDDVDTTVFAPTVLHAADRTDRMLPRQDVTTGTGARLADR
ncbi:hypothetical protein GCM10023094_06490 [Rhodococcus olei]|uniref:Uncharacterized protein n=2 Tax=Rhodococcus olei TaxID=2161675 RepID=A0ABP8NX46_9NOCA